MSKIFILLLCAMTLTSFAQSNYPKKMIVNISVADLRAIPQAQDPNLKLPTSDLSNPLQITQLLLGEQVVAQEECVDANNQKWLSVSTLQQEFFYPPLGWHGYPGWIQEDQLIEVAHFAKHSIVVNQKLADVFDEHHQKIMTVSMGTRLVGIEKMRGARWQIQLPNHQTAYIACNDVYEIEPKVQESAQQLRQSIIATASKFIGDWYSWGGRSAQNDEFGVSSVDCSSLIGLSFLAHGLQIPRMSHEQFLRSKRISNCANLQPGDLIFFASITKHCFRMDHVMLYLGNDQILETTFTDKHKARIVSFQERMGKPCHEIRDEDVIAWNNDEFHVHFGSFLNDFVMIQELRYDALKITY
jgi:cell wall-associated NlpC family hydrolase